MVTQYSTGTTPTGEKLYTASADPIDVTKLGAYSTPPVPPTDTTNYNGIVAGGATMADTAINQAEVNRLNAIEQAKIASTPSAQDTLLKQLGETTAPSSVDLYNKQYAELGLAGKEQEVSNLTAQLKAIQAETQAGQLSQEGRLASVSAIGGTQAQIAREQAIKSLPIQAQLAAAQGNLQLAQDRLNTSFKLASEDVDRQYQSKLKQIEYGLQFADKKEARALEEMKLKEQRAYDEKKARVVSNQSWAELASKAGQYDIASKLANPNLTIGEATTLISQIKPPVDTQIINLDNGSTVLVNKNTGQIIKTIAGASPSKEQKAAVEAQVAAQKRIPELNTKVGAIQDLLNDPYLKGAVGPNAFDRSRYNIANFFTGGIENFVAGVSNLVSNETLGALLDLKKAGGTLGALSDQERIMLRDAATKISHWEVTEDGKVTGYRIGEAAFKAELKRLQDLSKKAVMEAQGVSANDPLGLGVGADPLNLGI